MRRSAIPYRDALRWLLANDDCHWLDQDEDDANGMLSISASLVADIYGRPDEEVRRDLLSERKKQPES